MILHQMFSSVCITVFSSFQLIKLDVHYKYITLCISLFHSLKVGVVNSKCTVSEKKPMCLLKWSPKLILVITDCP